MKQKVAQALWEAGEIVSYETASGFYVKWISPTKLGIELASVLTADSPYSLLTLGMHDLDKRCACRHIGQYKICLQPNIPDAILLCLDIYQATLDGYALNVITDSLEKEFNERLRNES